MSNPTVQGRVPPAIKKEAARVLKSVGLTPSDYVRMSITHLATTKQIPRELLEIPNAKTMRAIKQAEAGKGKSYAGVDELMADLNADD